MDPIKQVSLDEAMKAMESLVGFKLTGVNIEMDPTGRENLNLEFNDKFRLSFPVTAIDRMRFLVAIEVPRELTIQ